MSLSSKISIGIPFTEPQGTYFVLADIRPYMRPGQNDLEFCEEMTRRIGVAAVPGSSFFREGGEGIVRLHYAKKDSTLYEALNRLNDINKMKTAA